MDLVVSPQSNLAYSNGLYVSLTEPSHTRDTVQMWRLSYTNKYGNKHRATGKGLAIDRAQGQSWGFQPRGSNSFEIRTHAGKVLYIDARARMAVKVRSRKNNAEERFFFDRKTKTI